MRKFIGSVLLAVMGLCLLVGCSGTQTGGTAQPTQAVQTAKATQAARDLSAYKALCEPLDYENEKENLYTTRNWVYFNATVIEVLEQTMEGTTYQAAVASLDDDPGNWIYFIAEKQGNGIKADKSFTVYGQVQGMYVYEGMGVKTTMPKVFVVYYDQAQELEPEEDAQAEQADAPQAEQPEE